MQEDFDTVVVLRGCSRLASLVLRNITCHRMVNFVDPDSDPDWDWDSYDCDHLELAPALQPVFGGLTSLYTFNCGEMEDWCGRCTCTSRMQENDGCWPLYAWPLPCLGTHRGLWCSWLNLVTSACMAQEAVLMCIKRPTSIVH